MNDTDPPTDSATVRPRKSTMVRNIAITAIAILAIGSVGWIVVRLLVARSQPDEPKRGVPAEKQLALQIDEILAGKSTQLSFADVRIDDDLLRELPWDAIKDASQEAKRLDTVLVDRGVITDKGVREIARLPDLEHLRLRLSPVTDQGIESLSGCHQLWLLNLPHSRITVDGIRSLQNLPRLKQLRLGSPNLHNECCRAIAELKSLRGLHLIGVPVTDEGLKLLAGLPHLESLYLDDSAVTESGWLWLFRNQPELHVHVDQRHHDRDPHAHRHHSSADLH